MSEEVTRRVTIRNRQGLHARPAAEFVKVASKFESEIHVRKDDLEVNGKSIMGVMMLAAEPGAELELSARGADADSALDALISLVDGGFGEDGDENS